MTRYRMEAREFHYRATEVTGKYDAQLDLVIDRGTGAEPFLVTIKDDWSKTGIMHDVEFPPAAVHPQATGLPGQSAFFSTEEAKLHAKMLDALNER